MGIALVIGRFSLVLSGLLFLWVIGVETNRSIKVLNVEKPDEEVELKDYLKYTVISNVFIILAVLFLVVGVILNSIFGDNSIFVVISLLVVSCCITIAARFKWGQINTISVIKK